MPSNPKQQRVLVIWLDYTNLPRAWGDAPADKQAEAEEIADEQLKLYCAKQAGLEPMLADPKNYTRQIQRYVPDQRPNEARRKR